MSRISAIELLNDARMNQYAIGAFSAHTSEMVQGIIEAAAEQRSPIIIQIGQRAIRHCGFGPLISSIRLYGEQTDVPVIIHLDHGKSYEQAIEAIRAGCTSVMFDGSHYELDKNIAITRDVVRAAHAVGIAVEGELGKIPGVEDDLSVDEQDAYFTNPELAFDFCRQTQVDSIAVAIGSAHGLYKATPQLDMERLRTISGRVGIPIVLHGGSGIPDDQIREAVKRGIAKINVDTELRHAYTQGMRETLERHGHSLDVYSYARNGADKVKQVVVDKIRLFGSSGKA